MFYSMSTGGFYKEEIHGNSIPGDAVEITDELYAQLIAGQSGGMSISWDETTSLPMLTEPQPVVPVSITPRQGMLILSRYNLLTPVQAALASMDGQAGVEARIDFERAQEWRRDWPLLVGMATQFGLSSAQIDQMFIEASQL